MGLRSAVALQQGATEELLDKTRRADDAGISSDQRAALLLCQAFLEDPAHFGATDAAGEVRIALTAAQIVELLVRLVMWSSDKVLIALGLDLDEPKSQLY
jgi:hypothetical protein